MVSWSHPDYQVGLLRSYNEGLVKPWELKIFTRSVDKHAGTFHHLRLRELG
jgi:subtilisin-like proprotein convertase family protein